MARSYRRGVSPSSLIVAGLAVVICLGCRRSSHNEERPFSGPLPSSTPRAAATTTTSGPGSVPSAPSAPADDCGPAYALLDHVGAKTRSRPQFRWRAAEQVALANMQSIHVVPTDSPAVFRPEVAFIEGHRGSDAVLGLLCDHGSTCRTLATAYASVVRSSKPESSCGTLPPSVTAVSALELLRMKATRPAIDMDLLLPGLDDVEAGCARLAACRAARDGRLDGDPLAECVRAPKRFRLSCANTRLCLDVLACVEK